MREEVIKVVSVLDPAIDTEAMHAKEMGAYLKTRGDYRQLKYKAGKSPTIFHVREVPHNLMESWVLADSENEAQIQRRCFQAAVVRVENLYQRDGTMLASWEPKHPDGRKADVIPDESLERFSVAERMEIGKVAWDRSFLHPRIEPSYLLPPMLLTSLGRREFLPAELSQSTPGSINDEASSRPESLQQPLPMTETDRHESADLSDSPTAATAEATQ